MLKPFRLIAIACGVAAASLCAPTIVLAQDLPPAMGGSVSTSSTTSGAIVTGGTSGGSGISSTGGTSTTSGFCIPGGLGCGPDSDLTPLGTPVPEPSSAALLLIGFGIVAAGSIRRRRRAAA